MAKAESSCVIWSRGIFRHAQSVIFALPHMVFTMASEQSEEMSSNGDASISSVSVDEPAGLVLPRRQGRRGSRGRSRGRPRSGSSTSRSASRGRRRGSRGRGIGRGDRARHRADEAEEAVVQMEQNLEDKVDSMSADEAKEMLKKVARRHPSLILDIIEARPQQPGGYHPAPDSSTLPDWCSCNRCRDMPTPEERLCCGQLPDSCVSQLPDFRVLMLDEAVLALARMYRQDVLAIDDDEGFEKANRHAAYRQFTLWQHGRLGTGIRRVIPSCCVWRIRDKYPDPFGQYKGYIPSRLV